MKNSVTALSLMLILLSFGCGKTELVDTTTVELVGSKWMSFEGNEDFSPFPTFYHDYKDVYNVLSFHADTVDYYFSLKDGVNTSNLTQKFPYKFSTDKLIISEFGVDRLGTKNKDTLNIYNKKYIKKL